MSLDRLVQDTSKVIKSVGKFVLGAALGAYFALSPAQADAQGFPLTLRWKEKPQAQQVNRYKVITQQLDGGSRTYGVFATNVCTNGYCFFSPPNLITGKVYRFSVSPINIINSNAPPISFTWAYGTLPQAAGTNATLLTAPNIVITNTPAQPQEGLAQGVSPPLAQPLSGQSQPNILSGWGSIELGGTVSNSCYIAGMGFGQDGPGSINFTNEGGYWTGLAELTQAGTNYVSVIASNFCGLSSTNTVAVYNRAWYIDSDGDGIENWDEMSGELGFVSNPNNPDTDHDGRDDWWEYVHGTNPSDSVDAFKPQITRTLSGGLELSFYAKSNQNYYVFSAQDLKPVPYLYPFVLLSPFTETLSYTATNDGSVTFNLEQSPQVSNSFYQVFVGDYEKWEFDWRQQDIKQWAEDRLRWENEWPR